MKFLSALTALALLAVPASTDFAGFLDSGEMDSVHYSVVIDGNPVKKTMDGGDVDKSNNFVTMTNKFGQKYRCALPDISDLQTGGQDHHHQDDEGENVQSQTLVQEIKALLAPLGTRGRCLFRTKEWWTYEFCYGRNIQQYHMEDGKPSGAIVDLGRYNNDYEWPEEDSLSPPSSSTPFKPRYHSQYYLNGTECDLTGNMRKTEVKFHCDPSATEDYISQVEEPVSCEYVLHVRTDRICRLPKFRPPPQPKPREIECRPLLTDAEYEKFLQYEIEKKTLEEIRQRKAEELRKQRMLELVGDDAELVGVDVESSDGIKIVERRFEEKLAEKLAVELGALLTPDALMRLDAGGGSNVLAVHKFVGADDLNFLGRKPQVSGGKKEFLRLVGEVAERSRIRKELRSDDQEDNNEDVEMDRKVRSDVVSEDDIVDDFAKEINDMPDDKREFLRAKAKSQEFQREVRKELSESLEEIIAETEREVGGKLSLEGRQEAADFKELWQKLEGIEERISKVNSDLSRVQDFIDESESVLAEEEAGELGGEREHYKHDGTLSVKRELREEEGDFEVEEDEEEKSDSPFREDAAAEHVKVKVSEVGQQPKIAGLKDEASSERVSKRLESVIKSKLSQAGLDTGGRQIEVKLVTSTFDLSDLVGGDGDDKEGDDDGSADEMGARENQQFQDMIYNLVTGNQDAYNDIDHQRKSERNYKFQWDDDLLRVAQEKVLKDSEGQESKDKP